MQPLDRRVRAVHHPEGVAVELQRAGIQSRPVRDAGGNQPLLEPPAGEFTLGGIDRIFAALAGIEPRDQGADHRRLVLLHQIPQRHVDRHAARLNPGDGLGRVFAPVHHPLRIDRREMTIARELTAQQFGRIANVFLAIVEHGRLTVFAPAALADRLGHLRLVDLLPTLDAVGAAGVGQTLALLVALLVGIVGQQDVADREVGGVQIVDVFRESASRAAESRSSRPRANSRPPACRRRSETAARCRTRRASVGWSRCAGNSRRGYRRPGTTHSADRRPRSHIRNRGRRCGGNVSAAASCHIRSGPAWPRSGATARDAGRGRYWLP